MTAKTIYDMALCLAGRDMAEDYIDDNEPLKRNALFFINQVLLEFSLGGVSSLSSKIELSKKTADAVIYGVARLIAAAVSDTDKQNELTDIFNAKRSSALSSTAFVKNRIPV